MYSIYVLKDPITKEVRYVGQTKYGIRTRLSHHLAERNTNTKCLWIADLKKQSLKPDIEVVLRVKNRLDAGIAEQTLMTYFYCRSKNKVLNTNSSQIPKEDCGKYRDLMKKGKAKYIYNGLHKKAPHLKLPIKPSRLSIYNTPY